MSELVEHYLNCHESVDECPSCQEALSKEYESKRKEEEERYFLMEEIHEHNFLLQNDDQSASQRYYKCSNCQQTKGYGLKTSSNPYECTHPNAVGRTCEYCGSYIRGDELG